MLLTYNELEKLMRAGVIENGKFENINAASLDITLGDILLTEDTSRGRIVDLSKKQSPVMVEIPYDNHHAGWLLWPGQVALASTDEVFHLPDDVAFEYKLKSSHARAFLNAALAGWADPGFNNATLTLELKNWSQSNILLLKPRMPIGQLVFWRGEPVPRHASYRVRGNYNGQRAPQPAKETPSDDHE
jgi:dCTP deaminase